MKALRWLGVAMMGLGTMSLAACANETDPSDGETSGSEVNAATGYSPFDNLDSAQGEALWPNEKRDIEATRDIITTFIKRRAQEGRTDMRGRVRYLRDAHAKGHGCVKGDFHVRSDIPQDFKAGVFTEARDFKTWIRYSNGNSEIRYDWKKDARGMAIKLPGVKGKKVVADFPEQSTQDFVMINHPVFFVDNPVHYAETLKVFHSGLGFEVLGQVLSIARMPLENAKLALAVNGSSIDNPLYEPYWSMAPIKLGATTAMKYAAVPVACGQERTFPADIAHQKEWIAKAQHDNHSSLPSFHRDDLREAMQKTLESQRKDVCYLFVAQKFIDLEKTPIEHSTVNWDDVAPMVPVADLRIPAQTFSSEAQDTFCDDMAFTPWHALPEHKPLGVVNRTRFVVYTATAKLRRENNHPNVGSALSGPTGNESF